MSRQEKWELSARIPREGDKRWSNFARIRVPLKKSKLIPLVLKQFSYFSNLKRLEFNVVHDQTQWNEILLSRLYLFLISHKHAFDVDMQWMYISNFNRNCKSLTKLGYLLGMIARTVCNDFRALIDEQANQIFMKSFLTASDYISRKKAFKGPYIFLGASYRSPPEMSEKYQSFLNKDIFLGEFKYDERK